MKFIYNPRILLPEARLDLSKWAVIACDQYTSERNYWDALDASVGDMPSTLRMIFPECYLGGGDEDRIQRINRQMDEYQNTILTRPVDGFVLVRRETTTGQRLGLVAAIDLEQYDFAPGTTPAIRPTEGTIEERLPPRIKIRKNAPLETSHVLLLVDDPEKTFIEPLYIAHRETPPLYDFTLYGGQRITGWAVPETAASALSALYEVSGGMLFAVGDGNHSLATAKRVWEAKKESLTDPERRHHPARYAMVEINNLHAPSLIFEPIHRAVFGGDVDALSKYLADKELECDAPIPVHQTAKLQAALDEWLSLHPEFRLDYIHGKDALSKLVQGGAYGIELSTIDKNQLFDAVRKNGPLPRKAFSIGTAEDKRYYLECRRLNP